MITRYSPNFTIQSVSRAVAVCFTTAACLPAAHSRARRSRSRSASPRRRSYRSAPLVILVPMIIKT